MERNPMACQESVYDLRPRLFSSGPETLGTSVEPHTKQDISAWADAGTLAHSTMIAFHHDIFRNRVKVTKEDDRDVCRKADQVILIIMIWVYFLQVLDKAMLGYAATFGLQADAHLQDFQYALVGSTTSIIQLAVQPFSFLLILKVPFRILMPIMVLGWGIAQTCAVTAHSFRGLMAYRSVLGLFEAGCLPLVSVMTSIWYRRSEQTIRIAAWYGSSGLATAVGAALSYGLDKTNSQVLASWQLMFLVTGLITIVTVPLIYWKLDNEPSTARFLTETEQRIAIERLRANQAGADSHEIRWSQLCEVFVDLKTYVFFAIGLGSSLGAQVSIVFGPLVLTGLGYDPQTTSLLNIPFGATQYIIIMLIALPAAKLRWQSLTLGMSLFPVIIGLVVLFVVPRTPNNNAALLVGYYLLAFNIGFNSLIIAWILANTAGQTKKAAMMSLYNAAVSAGNITGPFLFKEDDAPKYAFGLKATLGAYIAVFWLVIMQVANLVVLNRMQDTTRVARGKPSKLHDHSMDRHYTEMCAVDGYVVGNFAFADLTDRQNDEFIYVY